MEHKAYFKNKAGSNAVTTYSHTKRNIPRGLCLEIILCIALTPLKNELNGSD